MTNIRKERNNDFYFVMQALNWTKSVIHQGNRVLNNNLLNEITMELLNTNPELNINIPEKYISYMDDHFFIIALSKTIVYFRKIKKIRELKNDVKEILNKIDKEIGIENIINIRNMKEHDDEYVLGKGNKQDDFITDSGVFAADATSTIIIQGKAYLIGGKIDVKKTIEIYKNILPKVELIYKKYIKIDRDIRESL